MSEKERPFPIEKTPEGGYKLRTLTCWDCGGEYQLPYENHLSDPRHRAWKAEQKGQTEITAFDAIPDEPTAPLEEDPRRRLVFGDVKVCPRCRGTLRPERKDRKGNTLPADTFTHDPIDREGRCAKCKGTGVVTLVNARG